MDVLLLIIFTNISMFLYSFINPMEIYWVITVHLDKGYQEKQGHYNAKKYNHTH